MGLYSLITGRRGPSGFGSASTAEEVTLGIDATNLTAIITGSYIYICIYTAMFLSFIFFFLIKDLFSFLLFIANVIIYVIDYYCKKEGQEE